MCMSVLTAMAKDIMKKLRKSSQKEGVSLSSDMEPNYTTGTMTSIQLACLSSLTVLDRDLASDAQQFSRGTSLGFGSI